MKTLVGMMILLACVGLVWSQPPPVPPGLSWNRYESQNFEILSISKEEGQNLYENIEKMRKWNLERWGIKSDDFITKVKIMLVPDKETFVKLFKKQNPSMRIDRETTSGKIKATSIWLWAEPRWNTGILQQYLMEICLCEFEQKYNIIFPVWAHLGMAGLNTNLPTIRNELSELNNVFVKDQPCFWSNDLLTMTTPKLLKYSEANQNLFRREAMALCLYLQKEQRKFIPFLEASMQSPVKGMQVLGFNDAKQFDSALHAYMSNLSKDLVDNKVPNSYLTWR